MISSGRQSGRRLDTSHRRAGRDRRGMEVNEPKQQSPAAADPGLGATARRQPRRGRGRPGNVVLRARRSACGILELPWKYDFRISLKDIAEKNDLLRNQLIFIFDCDVSKLRSSRECRLYNVMFPLAS